MVSSDTTSASVPAGGGTVNLTATVTGTSNTDITWSIQESGGGTVITPAVPHASNALYIAPAIAGTYHVVATSAADATKSAVITVTVTPDPGGPTIAISPAAVTLLVGGSQDFTATVANASNTSVTWSSTGASGISNLGNNVGRYSAPQTPGTYYVIAVGQVSPIKMAVATVTTVPYPQATTISLSPTSATMFTGSSQQFSVTVSNAPDARVTWSIQEGSVGGAFSRGFPGWYTSSLTPGTYHLVATSVFDPTKSATATVTINAPPPGSGSFTQTKASGSYSPLSSGAVTGDAEVQLADGSILSAGGNITIYNAFDFTSDSAVLSLDNSGALLLSQGGNMNYMRYNASGALMPDGRVLIAGGDGSLPPGSVGGAPPTATAEIYDPKTRSFTLTGSMTQARFAPLLLPQKDGTILVLGGLQSAALPVTGEFYNPATGTFGNAFSVAAFPASIGAVLKDGRILFAGGTVSGSAVATAEIFDPATRTLTPTGNMTTPRTGFAAATLPDGTVLIAGGNQGFATQPLTSAEIYDPATGTFTAVGNALEPLSAPAAAVLPSGKVLIAAGNSITAELYDPSTRKFTVAAQMPPVSADSGVQEYRMFVMPNGSVMLSTGLSSPFNFYHP